MLAVNKMDLVDFDRTVFEDIVDEFDRILPDASLHPIPISALHGDNVITRSERTPWFDGASLLEFLETVEVDRDRDPASRSVSRCSSCCGRITSFAATPARLCPARSAPAISVTAWPSGPHQRVKRIVTWDGDLDDGSIAGMSVTLTLEDEIDISRGDMLAVGDIEVGQRFRAESCGWTSGRSIPAACIC